MADITRGRLDPVSHFNEILNHWLRKEALKKKDCNLDDDDADELQLQLQLAFYEKKEKLEAQYEPKIISKQADKTLQRKSIERNDPNENRQLLMYQQELFYQQQVMQMIMTNPQQQSILESMNPEQRKHHIHSQMMIYMSRSQDMHQYKQSTPGGGEGVEGGAD
eukprot:946181_1